MVGTCRKTRVAALDSAPTALFNYAAVFAHSHKSLSAERHNEVLLSAALAAWARSNTEHQGALQDASKICLTVRDTDAHQAYAWAALTCGRVLVYRGELVAAEVLLAEALGRFLVSRDTCGERMANAHLSVAKVYRSQLDLALELCLSATSKMHEHTDFDQCTLHNIVAGCYCARDEAHQAVPHLVKAYALAKKLQCLKTQGTILGNLGVILQHLGNWELSLRLSREAWALEQRHSQAKSDLKISHLANVVLCQTRLHRHEEATVNAKALMQLWTEGCKPIWHVISPCCEALAMAGHLQEAEVCLTKLVAEIPHNASAGVTVHVDVGRAAVALCQGNANEAAAITKSVLERPVALVGRGAHESAALVLAKASTVLGRKSDAVRWERFATSVDRERLFGDLVVSQIKAGLLVESEMAALTERELSCLNLAARGQTSADIGHKLGITTRTVNFHFAKILRKLHATNRQEAIAKAVSAGLVRTESRALSLNP